MAFQTGYFQAAEIRTLLQLLHVIDNPLQDIPLYGTLVSFFGGFTKEEIASVRAADKKVPLYDLLNACQGALQERIRKFLDWLSYYRKKTAYTPIHKLIQEILTDTGYLDYVTARPGGQQRRANVEMLLTRAAAYEKTSYYGLFHFLRYVEQLEKYEVDYGEADVLDENADVVRIMSIHKSKGLEFPVCFVAGLSKKFNMQDLSGRLIADIDMGIGVDYVDSSLRLKSHTLKKNVVALKMKLDALGEEMRVLYVAMTRAKEKLILTAMTDDTEKFREKLEQMEQEKESGEQLKDREGKVPFSALLGAGCYLDFIFPCMEDVELVDPGKRLIGDIEGAVSQIRLRQNLEMTETDNKLMAQLSEQFGRTYPYQYLSGLYVKTTVSELKKKGMHDLSERSMEELEGGDRQGQRFEQAFGRKLYEEPEIVPYIPSFIRAKEKMSGADRGSAYHKVMELLDFMAISRTEKTPEGIKAQLNRQMDDFVSQGLLEQTWREGISMAKLYTFFESSLAGRMMQAAGAGKLWREQPFVLGLAAGRLGEEFPEGEQVLIQGIIDVFFEENGEIVVADYKTDAVSDPKELIARYQIQLDYYEEALARLTDKKVMQKIIYSFALGQEIVLY